MAICQFLGWVNGSPISAVEDIVSIAYNKAEEQAVELQALLYFSPTEGVNCKFVTLQVQQVICTAQGIQMYGWKDMLIVGFFCHLFWKRADVF